MATLNVTERKVPIDMLVPNTWNPNAMSEFMMEKERESIRRFGFIDPCTVRKHPTSLTQFEIIDGEHRWRAAQLEGHTEVSVVDLGPISDEMAQELTIVLNLTRGQSDRTKLGRILAHLEKVDAKASRAVLPFTDQQFSELVQAAEFDWSKLSVEDPLEKQRDNTDPDLPTGNTEGGARKAEFSVRLNAEELVLLRAALDKARGQFRLIEDADALVAIARAFVG